MAGFNYGGRIGMSTTIRIVKSLCKIYLVYQERIVQYINDSGLTGQQKTDVINWLNLASASCAILTSIEYTYE